MQEKFEPVIPQKDPEVVKFQRALEDQALQYLIETRSSEEGAHALWNIYRQELSPRGNLLNKEGKETDKRPSHLILDTEVYKELEQKAREVPGGVA